MTNLSHSPLSSLTIEEIFSANPRTLTDSDHLALVVELRARRSEFQSQEAAKAAAGKKARVKPDTVSAPEAAKLDKPTSQLTLDDFL